MAEGVYGGWRRRWRLTAAADDTGRGLLIRSNDKNQIPMYFNIIPVYKITQFANILLLYRPGFKQQVMCVDVTG
jgi:hypothetical protein